jgi:hypothetical protein
MLPPPCPNRKHSHHPKGRRCCCCQSAASSLSQFQSSGLSSALQRIDEELVQCNKSHDAEHKTPVHIPPISRHAYGSLNLIYHAECGWTHQHHHHRAPAAPGCSGCWSRSSPGFGARPRRGGRWGRFRGAACGLSCGSRRSGTLWPWPSACRGKVRRINGSTGEYSGHQPAGEKYGG